MFGSALNTKFIDRELYQTFTRPLPRPFLYNLRISQGKDLSIEHQQWVLNLATELRESGVDVILDKRDLKEGA
jgi:hypothetical protein